MSELTNKIKHNTMNLEGRKRIEYCRSSGIIITKL